MRVAFYVGIFSVIFASACLSASSLVYAYQTPSSTENAYDCSNVALDDIDPNSLTREERIALLEGRLRESIDSYSTCITQVTDNMNGGGSGAYAGAQGDSGSSEASETSSQTGDSEAAKSDSQSNSEHAISVNTTPVNRGVIPPKDNDKIICKLLFQEIKSTQDTAMLKGLKEQYSNYACGGL